MKKPGALAHAAARMEGLAAVAVLLVVEATGHAAEAAEEFAAGRAGRSSMPSGMSRRATCSTSVLTCTLTTAGFTCSTMAEKSAGAGV